MPLVLADESLIDELDSHRLNWLVTLRIGLYQNDFVPFRGMSIGNIEIADFSGYVGYRNLFNWQTPVLDGTRSITTHADVTWAHDGGPVQNWIYGYYVLTMSGKIAWAEKREEGPLSIVAPPNAYRVVPRFSFRSEFPE